MGGGANFNCSQKNLNFYISSCSSVYLVFISELSESSAVGTINKGLVPTCHSFLIYYFSIETYSIYTDITLVEAHSNILIADAQSRDLHRGDDRGIEPGPAVQQADALLSELRGTLTELRRTLLSYIAPYELRRTRNNK